MKILVTGSTGLIGSALVPFLHSSGYDVLRLVRSKAVKDVAEVRWDPEKGEIDSARLDGLESIVHLAGENIADGRWTEEKKRRILDSRVRGTRLISETLAALSDPPKSFLCASAIGYYGDRGTEILREDSSPGNDFLADVCSQWERATQSAVEIGIRVVRFRLGVVLSEAAGALAKMLAPFQFGLGGRIGNGRQYMSWIDIDDVVGGLRHLISDTEIIGPVNFVAPRPVTNLEFTKTLGKVLSRPTVFPVPAFAARLAFGEMADALLLSSARVLPDRLAKSGYLFKFPELENSLRHLLDK